MARLLVIVTVVLGVVSAATLAVAEQEVFQVGIGTPVTWTYDATPATSAITVAILNNADPRGIFEPQTIDIAAGSTVIWTNLDEDMDPHTATAVELNADGDPLFNSGRLNLNKSYAHTFDTPGDFSYRCDFHTDMTGLVRVT